MISLFNKFDNRHLWVLFLPVIYICIRWFNLWVTVAKKHPRGRQDQKYGQIPANFLEGFLALDFEHSKLEHLVGFDDFYFFLAANCASCFYFKVASFGLDKADLFVWRYELLLGSVYWDQFFKDIFSTEEIDLFCIKLIPKACCFDIFPRRKFLVSTQLPT